MGPDGASCFHTLTTTDDRDIPKEQWDEERFGMMCTKSENFANWKTVIEQLCSKMPGMCTYHVKEQLTKFFKRADEMNQAQMALKLQ
jgi:hypothetical protein